MTPNEKSRYDVAILGAGPGGYECAADCARRGLKTALIEARELGGTCLNRGCIPTKALLHSAELYREALDAAKFGVAVENVAFDFAVANERRRKAVSQLRGGIESLEKAAGVDVLFGRGVLTGPNSLRIAPNVGEPFEIDAEKIVVATGAAPFLPPIPGVDAFGVWTSDDLLAADALPKSVVIVGGGVVGVEFASLFGALGKKVDVLEAAPTILPGLDPDLPKLLLRKFKSLKINVKTNIRVLKIDVCNADSAPETVVSFDENGATKTVAAERCVVCVGRAPATRGLGLDAAGVATDARGFIPVDEFLRTNVPNILAIGDVSGKLQLAHVAAAQARIAARVCAEIYDETANYDVVPSCVYSSPELASVGKTEAAARAAGLDVAIGSFRLPANGKARAAGVDFGLVKIVADAATRKILGAQIVSPRATDSIAEIALAMKLGATVDELAATIHPHPSFAEALADASKAILNN